MGVKATVQKVGEALGATPKDTRRFDKMRHPAVVETAKAHEDLGARLEAERAKLPAFASAALEAKAAVRAARLKAHAGVGKDGELAAAKKALEAADDALEAQRDLLEALGGEHHRAGEAHRRAIEAAERETAEAIHEAVRQNIAEMRRHVEGVGEPSKRTMLQLAEEREQLAAEADALSPWGSPAAQRIGVFASMGETGRCILTGRGHAGLGPHALNAVFLRDPYTQGGCSWDQFIEAARRLGLTE
jgi:hypothetical protein